MYGLEAYLAKCGLEPSLLHLLKFRVSQINGCAYCLDMHSKDLRAAGESEQRLYLLDAWREAPFYTERERAALAWAEAVTLVTEGHVPDEVYEQAQGPVQRRGAGEPDAGRRGDQRLEPAEHRLPRGAGQLPAGHDTRDRVSVSDYHPQRRRCPASPPLSSSIPLSDRRPEHACSLLGG